MRNGDARSALDKSYLIRVVVVVLLALVVSCAGAGAGGGSNGTDPDDPDDPIGGDPPTKPVAHFTVTPDSHDVVVTIFEELLFDAGGSTDDTGNGPIVEYRWSFTHNPADGFEPTLQTQIPQTSHMYRRFRDGGYIAALVVVNAVGTESDVFTRIMYIDDREGGIVVVE